MEILSLFRKIRCSGLLLASQNFILLLTAIFPSRIFCSVESSEPNSLVPSTFSTSEVRRTSESTSKANQLSQLLNFPPPTFPAPSKPHHPALHKKSSLPEKPLHPTHSPHATPAACAKSVPLHHRSKYRHFVGNREY